MVVFYSSCDSWLEEGGIPLLKSNRLRESSLPPSARPWAGLGPARPASQGNPNGIFLGLVFFAFLVRSIFKRIHFKSATLSTILKYHQCCYLTHKTQRDKQMFFQSPPFWCQMTTLGFAIKTSHQTMFSRKMERAPPKCVHIICLPWNANTHIRRETFPTQYNQHDIRTT